MESQCADIKLRRLFLLQAEEALFGFHAALGHSLRPRRLVRCLPRRQLHVMQPTIHIILKIYPISYRHYVPEYN
jgi:hypothetical protein